MGFGRRNGVRAPAPEDAGPDGAGEFYGADGCQNFAPDGVANKPREYQTFMV